MPRRTRAPKLENRSSRLKLPPRKKPYSVTIGPGVMLLYRRNQGAGTWGVRLTQGKDETHRVATADDFDEVDGREVLDFWQAQDAARAKAKEHKGAVKPATVAKALDDYEADLNTRGADAANVKRVRIHLSPEILARTVSSLRSDELRKWRGRLAKGMSAASVNRTATCLKAALNLAADDDERIASRPWAIGLATIRDAEQPRNVILSDAVVRRLVEESYLPHAAAFEQVKDPEARLTAEQQEAEWATAFGLLVEVLAVTGARISQVARLEVRDVQADRSDPRLMMPSSRKGKGVKKIERRPVPISPALALRLRTACASAPANASLLSKPGGDPWHKSDHSRRFARTVTRLRGKLRDEARDSGADEIGIASAAHQLHDVTIYALRHSSIVRQLLAGVPIRVVASGHDTSTAMIEKNYSRHITDHADAFARKALLDIAGPDDGNVVKLHA